MKSRPGDKENIFHQVQYSRFHTLLCFIDKTKTVTFKIRLTFEALISSSAKHSAMDLIFLKEASRAPVHNNHMAWLTRLNGATSTACRRTVPARPMRVESSRGPLLMMASHKTWRGF